MKTLKEKAYYIYHNTVNEENEIINREKHYIVDLEDVKEAVKDILLFARNGDFESLEWSGGDSPDNEFDLNKFEDSIKEIFGDFEND